MSFTFAFYMVFVFFLQYLDVCKFGISLQCLPVHEPMDISPSDESIHISLTGFS